MDLPANPGGRRRGRTPRPAAAVPILCAAAAFAGGASAQEDAARALELGRPLAGTLAWGDTARFAVAADSGHFVFGEVEQISVDVDVRILGPEGRALGRFGGLGIGAERFAGRATSAGAHVIEVLAAGDDEDAGGRFEIALLRLEPVAEDPAGLVDQMMARFDGPASPGAAVRVWRGGETLFSKAYGMASLTYGVPFEPATRTNVGSTSKQFTAFAVMLQAERGLLALDDDVRLHVPELPKFDETIRIRHLLTHTSGLREFLNLLLMTGRRLDRGDWIDRSEIVEIAQRQPKLQNSPGAEWNYNNTAFALAALIVERTSGLTFPAFMERRVFAPLGMDRTVVRANPRVPVPDRAEGYTPSAEGYLEIGDFGGAVGAGSIYSSTDDLQLWVENLADPRVGARRSVEEMTTPFVLADGSETGYGYGLFVDRQRGLKRVHHGGADVAHRSMLAWYPEIDAGVTVQSNHAQFASDVAFEVAEAFFGDEMTAAEQGESDGAADFDADAYDPADFDEFAGRYALDAAPDFVLAFTREASTLYAQATGQERLEIEPTSDSTFRVRAVDASVTFLRDEDGRVEGLTLHQNGDRRATRLDGDGARAWEPTEAELAEFAGRYYSDEIETFYALSVEDGALVVRQRRLGRHALAPGERDRFAGAGLSFEFERGRSGRVIGLYLANARTRDVRFDRVR